MGKRIAAWVGIVVIAGMYILSGIAAAMAKEEAGQMFMASLALTFIVPLLLWAYLKMYDRMHKDGGISAAEMKKINKRIQAGENPEDIAKEIEEKYNL